VAGKKKKKTKSKGKKARQKRINKIVIVIVVIVVASFSITAFLWGRRHDEAGLEEVLTGGTETEESGAEAEAETAASKGADPRLPKVKKNPAEELRHLKRNIASSKRYRGDKGTIVIIIDDVGYNLHQLKPFLDFPGPIVFAILPSLPYSEKAAELIRKHGKEYIIHQPMEAVSRQNLGPQAIVSGMKAMEIEKILGESIASLPEAVGMNNHMGSKVTADPELMKTITRYLEKNNRLFIDSLTTPHSAVKKALEDTGLPYIRRDVFLDNRATIGYYTDAFSKGKERANQAGYAVMIGHVQSEGLAEMLKSSYESAVSEGYTFAPVSKLPFVIERYADIGY